MEISTSQLNTFPSQTLPAKPAPPSPAVPDQPVKDVVMISRVSALLSSLQSDLHVRPEVVARGRLLASDPNYPPQQIIASLASLVASSEASQA
jgi:hypothetical protein